MEDLACEQQKRWGSCDRGGTIRINWKTRQALIRLVDDVVVPLLHKDHTPVFWTCLGQAMPDYDRRKDELRRIRPRLLWPSLVRCR